MKLMYITNDPEVAKIAQSAGVDWIFIDFEKMGKQERQGHLDTVISNHSIGDLKIIRSQINSSEILVRVNPINSNSYQEINEVIDFGADIIMLPYFKKIDDVIYFLSVVNKRIKTCLLLETPEAVEILDEIIKLKEINFIHVGLNDLHLGYNKRFMFELLSDGTVDKIANKINHIIPFGFGGIAKIGEGLLPSEMILAEHFRLKSEMVILSRSFCDYKKINDYKEINRILIENVKAVRSYEKYLANMDTNFFENNKLNLKKTVDTIINKIICK